MSVNIATLGEAAFAPLVKHAFAMQQQKQKQQSGESEGGEKGAEKAEAKSGEAKESGEKGAEKKLYEYLDELKHVSDVEFNNYFWRGKCVVSLALQPNTSYFCFMTYSHPTQPNPLQHPTQHPPAEYQDMKRRKLGLITWGTADDELYGDLEKLMFASEVCVGALLWWCGGFVGSCCNFCCCCRCGSLVVFLFFWNTSRCCCCWATLFF
jgi:hypothetical protein